MPREESPLQDDGTPDSIELLMQMPASGGGGGDG
jgi:hypothetical protein